MSAISYQVNLAALATGQGLEAVTTGTAAPTSGAGFIELRMDTTATAVNDASLGAGAQRPLKKGEIWQLLNYLQQYLERDVNITQ